MIIDLPDTTVSKISKALVNVREEGGAVALGRVLTLIIATRQGVEEEAIEAANDASREHPMRVIVIMLGDQNNAPRLDAQIRVGGDAGASEVIVLNAQGPVASNHDSLLTGLLLPDAPVVAWWPAETPEVLSTSPIGRIAQRRITDASAQKDPAAWLGALGANYAPGSTDFAWTRITRWREQLAAVLDQPPYEPVTAVEVRGAWDSPSTALLAAWLRLKLDVDVTYEYLSHDEWPGGIKSVRLERPSGVTLLERPSPALAVLTQPGQPTHDLAFPRRSLRECLAEELRGLDPDVLYGQVITEGLELLEPATETHG
ncbi:glucose-6-phosphate dehydrogenase assembly protein OpcA [Microbacterium sp. zg.B48]|uniref:glucose-6-phosphate dehydrogenase assembly protein OpcA n=1 Tax=unclassified Microbacterium TaxID=2609290 RepID=UPI00214CC03E|nr:MULTISPECIES: glucose-6-phosphate dehydrogenase assembly protein OpcA [unclassified Microbacterium]MCR2762152.1 glucose-6-phosphate dehydrogenase assembly protein OpcA [Microbacterium sp. zg.B48]MCR2809841.1 glucose-6-phosphate dehydrogenase assembly protein OpcA [Microbacterium sp. zg.B185]WIM17849.1 glucose-6-phosphate dehydrogenase assembly protein OpcA [Microbacterium sp. zg-B185]